MNENTRIAGSHPAADLEIGEIEHGSEFAFVSIGEGDARRSTAVPVTELTDAIAAHFPMRQVPADAMVIERDELPEVSVSEGHGPVTVVNGVRFFAYDDSPDALRQMAAGQLALAEYLAAHPPVDEVQVEAVFQLLNEHTSRTAEENRRLARRLVLGGVRIDTPKEQR